MATFYWVRTWDPYNNWSTYYEGWDQSLAQDYHGRIQGGSLVIADMIDDTPNAPWRRETWQSYSPVSDPGKPMDVGGAAPPDIALPPVPQGAPPPQTTGGATWWSQNWQAVAGIAGATVVTIGLAWALTRNRYESYEEGAS